MYVLQSIECATNVMEKKIFETRSNKIDEMNDRVSKRTSKQKYKSTESEESHNKTYQSIGVYTMDTQKIFCRIQQRIRYGMCIGDQSYELFNGIKKQGESVSEAKEKSGKGGAIQKKMPCSNCSNTKVTY